MLFIDLVRMGCTRTGGLSVCELELGWLLSAKVGEGELEKELEEETTAGICS